MTTGGIEVAGGEVSLAQSLQGLVGSEAALVEEIRGLADNVRMGAEQGSRFGGGGGGGGSSIDPGTIAMMASAIGAEVAGSLGYQGQLANPGQLAPAGFQAQQRAGMAQNRLSNGPVNLPPRAEPGMAPTGPRGPAPNVSPQSTVQADPWAAPGASSGPRPPAGPGGPPVTPGSAQDPWSPNYQPPKAWAPVESTVRPKPAPVRTWHGLTLPPETDEQGRPVLIGQGLQGGTEEQRHASLGVIRQRMASRIGSAEIAHPLEKGAGGVWRHTAGAKAGEEATKREIMSFTSKARTLGALKGAAGPLVAGEAGGMGAALGGLGSSVAGKVGTVGAVYTGAMKVASFAEEQRQANTAIREQTGQSDREAFGERGKEKLFSLGLRGTLGSSTSEYLYENLQATGMNNRDRGRGADFAVDQYKKLGMSIDQSLRVITMAAQSGNTSLNGYASALEGVTKAAKKAGVNAKQARDDFLNAAEGYIGQVGGGPGVPVLAQAAANAKSDLGRMGSKVDFSGLGSQSEIYQLGARTGVGAGGVRARMQSDPVWVAKQQQKLVTDRLKGTFNAPRKGGRSGTQILADAVARAPKDEQGNPMLAESQRNAMVQELTEAGINPDVVQGLLATAGINTDPGHALATASGFLTTQVDLGRNAEKTVKDSKRRSVGEGSDGLSVLTKDDKGLREAKSGNPMADLGVKTAKAMHIRTGDNTDENIKDAYRDEVKKSGLSSPLIRGLMDDPNFKSLKFKVETKGGKKRVVGAQEAIRNFADQLSRGDVGVVTEDGMEQSLNDYAKANISGITGDADAVVTSNEDEGKTKKGKSESDFNKDKKGKGGGGTVTLMPSPELAGLIRLHATGNVNVNPNSNYAPGPSNTLPSAKPGG